MEAGLVGLTGWGLSKIADSLWDTAWEKGGNFSYQLSVISYQLSVNPALTIRIEIQKLIFFIILKVAAHTLIFW